MKFVLQSDLHGNFSHIQAPHDPETYLILSGDVDEVHRINRHRKIIEHCTERFKGVFYVPGNHEYYGSNIHKVNELLYEMNNEFENLYVLLNTDYYFEEHNTVIIGSTLWSSFNKRDPLVMFDAANGMNDYKYIRHGTLYEPWRRKLRPDDTASFHDQTVNYLKNKVLKYKSENPDVKVVICTHHAPSTQSIHPRFYGDNLNHAYCTDLSTLINELNADVWTHGHMHDSFDYMEGSTRVICNPHGYMHPNGVLENSKFDPNFTFEV